MPKVTSGDSEPRALAPLGLILFAAAAIYLRHESWIAALSGNSRRIWRMEMLTAFFFTIAAIAPLQMLLRRGVPARESLVVSAACLATSMATYWLFGWVWGA